jgi:hypothetical protein
MSACDGSEVKIYNAGVSGANGRHVPIIVVAAGPSTNGGSMSPTVPPNIVIGHEVAKTFTVSSGDGSGGWARGSISIQLGHPSSVAVVTYAMEPKAIGHSSCTAYGTVSQSPPGYTITPTTNGSPSEGSSCWVQFSIAGAG